jgi:hypothetical protein
MPKNKIASTFVDNGTERHTNSLLIAWGPKGGAPDAPDGWVNAGYAHLAVSLDPHNGENPDNDHYVVLDEPAMDYLIATLRKIRGKTFRA